MHFSHSVSDLSLRFSLFVVLGITFFTLLLSECITIYAITNGTGFTQHLNLSSGSLTLTQWKTDIDGIAATGLTSPWIRLPLNDVDTFPRTNLNSSTIDCNTLTPTNCNPANINQYDQAINYAISKNIKVYLVTNVPSWAKLYSNPAQPWETKYTTSQYLTITNQFYNILATKWSAKVDVWQIFNEANIHIFDSYAPLTSTPSSYMNLLKQVINTAKTTIKSTSASEIITTNAGGYPFNNNLYSKWILYFNQLHQHLDQISIDAYPDTNPSEIANLSTRIQNLITTYNKPVNVTEIGMCTDIVRFTAVDQANYIPQYIQQSRNGGANLIFVYQYQDNDQLSAPCENAFGIVNSAGAQKPSYQAVMNAII